MPGRPLLDCRLSTLALCGVLGACGVDPAPSSAPAVEPGGAGGSGGSATGPGGGAGTGGSAGATGGAAGNTTTDACHKKPDGSYCGESILGEKGKLYSCEAGVAVSVSTCAKGCANKPGGVAVCQSNANEPCFDDADGAHCGETIGGPPNTVVTCKAHVTVASVICLDGCTSSPPLPPRCLGTSRGGDRQ